MNPLRDVALPVMVAAILAVGCETQTNSVCLSNAECGVTWHCDLTPNSETQNKCVPNAADNGDAGGSGGESDSSMGGAGGSGGAAGDGGASAGGSGGGGAGGMKPDAALPECATSSACVAANKPICDKTAPRGGACVACVSDGVCAARDPNAPLCDTTSGKCVACKAAADCKSATAPICNVAAGTCGGCKTSPECVARGSAGKLCDVGSGKCEVCLAHADCTTSTAPLCGTDKTCVTCNAGGGPAGCAARNAALPQCDTGNGTCVECNAHSECGVANKPICRGDACAACRQDGECSDKLGADPGICLDHTDGACATSGQVIYVQDIPACVNSPTAGGTATIPYCAIQHGIDAATADKNVVAVRGPGPFFGFAISTAKPGLSVIGQANAEIGPGAAVGISVSAGSPFIRGFAIRGGLKEGISASGSSTTLRADRLIVENNKGGILLNGAAFDIQNTLILGNRAATSGATSWGGVLVLALPAAGPKDLRNLTVANNLAPGVACAAPISASGLIAFNNTVENVVDTCAVAVCCTGDPLFTAAFHLQSGSPCLDKVPAIMSPVLDLDGNLRPSGPQSDCGAYELQQ